MTTQEQETPTMTTQTPVPMPYAGDYDAVCITDAVAFSVWGIASVYTRGSGKSAIVRTVNSSGIIASPTDILPPLELTARAIGGDSVADVFGSTDPATIAHAIAHAIDKEQTAQHSGAELARYAAILGSSYVQVRETSEGTTYTQRPMRATAWANDALVPLFSQDAAPYLMQRAAIDGTRRSMRTRAVPYAEHVSGAAFAAQRRQVLTRAQKRSAKAALHRALCAARTAAQDAAAALAAQDAAAALAAQDAAALAARAAQDAAHKLGTPRAEQDASAALAFLTTAQACAQDAARALVTA